MQRYLVIHGPNLNLLGRRPRPVYGRLTLPEIDRLIRRHARAHGFEVEIVQSNLEGEIVNAIQAGAAYRGLVINPGGYTHTSVAIRDALEAAGVPAVEVHLTNISSREEFRRGSLTAAACTGQIAGLGWRGYLLALDFLRAGPAARGKRR
jgi:3-dehydroquinate dehydratase-2